MPAAGSKLGPYEIQSPLGAGGMSGVHRTRDTWLDRTIPIKILSHLSYDPARKQRFEREAKAISELSSGSLRAKGYLPGVQEVGDLPCSIVVQCLLLGL